MKKNLTALALILCLVLVAAPAMAINVVQPTGFYADRKSGV